MTDIPVEPITPNLGVRIGLPAERLLDDGVPEQCLALLNRHGVLLFPQINASDATQVAFSNRLGAMRPTSLKPDDSATDKLGIYPVTLDPTKAKYIDYIHSNVSWHMDGTVYEVPPKATSLKCEVPASSGGDTEFANLFAAYAALPAARKAQLEGLRVVHSIEATSRRTHKNPTEEELTRWRATPPREHPLVWRHQDGRISLLIGGTADHIVGMPLAEGRALLEELLEWSTQPQFCYRHQWQRGDLVFWNNCGLLHRAHPYTVESGRLMHRTTIMGTEAIA